MENYSDLVQDTCDKLDGVWSVQLFYRTWPYYFRRANRIGEDPHESFDIVMSENVPLPDDFPEDIKVQLETYQKQLWAMSIVYIEAVLEHFFLSSIEQLDLSTGKYPRSAIGLFEVLKEIFQERFSDCLELSIEEKHQLKELNETRHLWIHKGGVVDQLYIRRTEDWWNSRPCEWFEEKPVIGEERCLTENYIKGNIWFSKKLALSIHDQITDRLSHS